MKQGTKRLTLPIGVIQELDVYIPESLNPSLPPVFFIHGWGTTDGIAFEEVPETIAIRTGRKVYAFAYTNALQAIAQEGGVPIPSQFQKWKQLVILQTAQKLAEQTRNGLDIVGYSEGAMHALLVAFNLNRIGDLYLLNPAGITGMESYISIILRALRNQIDMLRLGFWGTPEAKRRLKSHKKSIRAYLKRKPAASITQRGLRGILWRIKETFKDLVAPGRVDLKEIVMFLARSGNRIRICGFEDDAMIPAWALKKRYRDVRGIHLTMDRGTHQQVLVNPKEIAEKLMKW